MLQRDDTIFATVTGQGRAGVAIVRISGPLALHTLNRLCPPGAPPHATLQLRHLLDPFTGTILDEALVAAFFPPRSYTGEQVVELNIHGNPVLLRHLLALLTQLGLRPAQPGEFTLRAFLNGKKDLAQAEAVNDIVNASSVPAVAMAASSLAGSLSSRISDLGARLLETLARMEAEIDFPEDVPSTPPETVGEELLGHIATIQGLLQGFQRARFIRQGFRIVLAGAPNAGKSSLFNALVGHQRAIVTAEPGTTRDYIEEWLPSAEVPVLLVDTAGMRQVDSLAEAAGVQRSLEQQQNADLLLVVWNPLDPNSALTALETAQSNPANLFVATHLDTWASLHSPHHETLPNELIPPQLQPSQRLSLARSMAISSTSGANLQELISALLNSARQACLGHNGTLPLIANERQAASLQSAAQILEEALEGCHHLPLDIISSLVRRALDDLGTLIGKSLTDEVLDNIFSSFCIGK